MKKIILLSFLISGCSNPVVKPINDKVIQNNVKQDEKFENNLFKEEKMKNELIYHKSISEKPKFDTIKSVESGKRNAYITIFFKDSMKIRLIGLGENSFKSLSNNDTDNLNKIIKKYNINKIEANESIYLKSEFELEDEEKQAEKYYGVDYPNKASIYNIHVENIDIKSFIEELRKDSLVLSANENQG